VSTPDAVQPVAPQEILEWEAAERTRSGISAIVAAVFTFFGGIASGLIFADYPHVLAIDALKEAVGAGAPGAPGLKTQQVLFYDDHSVQLILVSLALAIGSAAMAPILGFLYRAAAARTPRLPKLALYAALIGPIAVAVATIVLQVATSIKASDFASASDQSTAVAHDALTGGVLLGATLLRQLGVLVVGLAFVLISLHAMRVGLLTKFLGILGIIAGVLFVVPLGGNLPVVQAFFLLAIGFLVMGRFPGAIPPAWKTGEAEPWPTQQEIREQRTRDAAIARGEDPDEVAPARGSGRPARKAPSTPAPLPRPGTSSTATAVEDDEDEGTDAFGTPHSSSKKKKRKRR